jgi:GH25 family lysozyme M1 (1,4-beta-N-acetylmuramidase)
LSRRFSLLSLPLLLLAGIAAWPASAQVRGIDVSRWKGSIDWSLVAASGTRFAFAEASNGLRADWTYATNRSGAHAVGVAFGAFHYARPSGSTPQAVIADAVAEASFFVSVARPQTGELTPVLDLERTGGLSAVSLRAWVAAWLDEVERRVGVRPTIYASPTFWRKAMADSGVFATEGSQLWVAHWRVRSPRVPAANWEAGGWTFWQWTNCSRVLGIRGCVDGDLFRGSGIADAVMAPPPVAVTPPTLLGLPQTGQTLSATPGTWSAAPSPTLGYRWERCVDVSGRGCRAIPGAVTSSYVVGPADAGSALRAVVTATSHGRSAQVASTPVPVSA